MSHDHLVSLPQPFGLPDCESEVKILEQEYQEIFFDETPFNQSALDENCYLIVGRRGSGKTALAHYFSFQRRFRGARLIYAPKPEIYQDVLIKLSREAGSLDDVAVLNLVEVWKMAVWFLIFRELDLQAPAEDAQSVPPPRAKTPSGWLKRFFN
ncbi:MAG TPA: hypothetical protein VFR31_06570, partial [Thermoanaerobaculia bacterium]|nr:hypothetical protein [Thermoanaerobaculia bacterium]